MRKSRQKFFLNWEGVMAKKADFKKIRSSKSYFTKEFCEAVGLSYATILKHIKNGLPADTESIPYLIYGREAKAYYENKYKRDKIPHGPNEIVCLHCKTVISLEQTPFKAVFTGQYYRPGKMIIQLKGNCPSCGIRFSRFKSFFSMREIDKGAEVPNVSFIKKGV